MCSRDHAADGQIRTGAALQLGAAARLARCTEASTTSRRRRRRLRRDRDPAHCAIRRGERVCERAALARPRHVLHSGLRGSNYLGNLFFFTLTQQDLTLLNFKFITDFFYSVDLKNFD